MRHSGQFRGQKGLWPLKKSLEMTHYMFCLRKKIISRTFKTELLIPGERETEIGREREKGRGGGREKEMEREREGEREREKMGE